MIFATFTQFNCFISFIFFGLIIGIFHTLFKIFFIPNLNRYNNKEIKKSKKNFIIIQKICSETIFFTIFCVFFEILLNFFNFGKFSLSLFLAYFIGYFWINCSLKNLVALSQTLWYNILNKFRQACKSRRANESRKKS